MRRRVGNRTDNRTPKGVIEVIDLSGVRGPALGPALRKHVEVWRGDVLFDCLSSTAPCGTGGALSEKCARIHFAIMQQSYSVKEYVARQGERPAHFVVFFHEKTGNIYANIPRAECTVDEEGNAKVTLRIRTKDQECKEYGTENTRIILMPLIGDKMQRAYYEITAEAKVEQLSALIRAVNTAGARLYRLKEYTQRLFDNNSETEELKKELGLKKAVYK